MHSALTMPPARVASLPASDKTQFNAARVRSVAPRIIRM
jgi:hypothetical protein